MKLAKTVATMDDAIDDLFNKVKQEVIDIINANKELDQQAIDVLLIAKYFEKSATTQRTSVNGLCFQLQERQYNL